MAILGDVAILSGLASARPTDNATDTKGRLYLATDTGIVARDNGTGWDEYATLLKLGTTATTAAAGNDSRLSDARTPTAHQASHATGGADALAPADIGAATAGALTAHTGSTSNPHAVTAAQAGAEAALGNPATDGYVLSSTAAGVRSWAAGTGGGGGGGGLTNPMTTQDDLIVGGASGAPARLGKGTDGQVLTVDPSTHHLIWATPSGAGLPLTNTGDLLVMGPVSVRADRAVTQAGSSNDTFGGYPPSYAFDTNDGSRWVAANGARAVGTFLAVDLGAPYLITSYRLLFYGAEYPPQFAIESSDDNAIWTARASVTPADGGGAELALSGTTARYWRMIVTVASPSGPMSVLTFQLFSANGQTLTRLGVGTEGQILKIVGGVPTWATP